jgi:hypothetical protein
MAWLAYAKRIPYVIDHTLVDADLTFQPHKLWLSADSGVGHADFTAFFAVMTDANKLKIAVTTSDGTTECYVEVASWDAANNIAELYVNIPAVSTAGDTTLYIYYDDRQADNSTYVGVTGSVPGKAVLDANFAAVYHMNDSPADAHLILDSTTNGNTGTKLDSTEPVEAAGLKGKAQSFDGSNDYIIVPDSVSLNTVNSFTVSVMANYDGLPQKAILVFKGVSYNPTYAIGDMNNSRSTVPYYWTKGGTRSISESGIDISTATTTDLTLVYNGTSLKLYKDGTDTSINNNVSAPLDTMTHLYIGKRNQDAYGYFKGLIDEIRISSIARPAAYIHLTDHSERDTAGSWGTEEKRPQVCGSLINDLIALGVI